MNKASGPDEILNEIFGYGEDDLKNKMGIWINKSMEKSIILMLLLHNTVHLVCCQILIFFFFV